MPIFELKLLILYKIDTKSWNLTPIWKILKITAVHCKIPYLCLKTERFGFETNPSMEAKALLEIYFVIFFF